MVNFTRSCSLLIILLFIFLISNVELRPVMKSGYSKNHHLFRPKNLQTDSEEGFWNNVYFVITASDSFFGG
ncbi:Heme Responsive Gene [Caenorhabditis elegans]|uniref:Heme Responsive protein n=1 Tax=Caenorhabditis elegans TaxID=6239 RepID=Q20983_CAEEL|nr:Heme Responsive Gene [Caenorhabditis elegans]CAA94777.2 Heme Responsive Gene [Caenorhabditis elegans]|eukprot:NP_505518.2 Heme Responsive Gene [Caenorhabditis elegans]